ncbi:leucine-rich repeat-containing protein 15-like [Dreissena polymorpha]|nr:leucine-rich repeat-containing protein 15-like [Dreissena polymorpha]
MLRILLLSNNPLTTLSDLTFSTPMLSLADFTDCRLTSVPRVMPPEVGDFRLGQNNLTRITLEDFQNITSLTLLTMNDNKINFVEHRSFEGLEDLKELWMSRNELVYIPRGLPKTLQKLYMDSNQVVELEQMLFKPDSALNVLNLEGNKVFKIHSEALKDAPQLTTLNLQGNAITRIESGTFTHSPNLESLTFTNNPIDVFKSGAFKNLGMLTEISLSYIDSKTTDVENLLPDFFFQEMPNVTEIDLMSSVKLTRAFLDKIKDGTAQPFTEVKLLNLQYNELKTLPQNIRSVFPNIKQLLLDGNMLVCDKNLLWLYDWMKTTEVSFHQYDLPTCDLPKSLYGQVIATLSRGDFVDTVDNIQETRNEQKPQNPPQQETAPVDPIQQASNQGNDITPPSTANNSPQPTNRNPEPAVTRSTGMAGTRVIIRPPKSQPQVPTDKSSAKASYSELARKAARKAEKERKKGEQFERRRSRRERNERNKNENDKRSEKRKIRNKKEKQGRKCEKDENGNIIKCARKQRDKKKCEVLADGTVRCKKSRGNKDKTIATPEAQRA